MNTGDLERERRVLTTDIGRRRKKRKDGFDKNAASDKVACELTGDMLIYLKKKEY